MKRILRTLLAATLIGCAPAAFAGTLGSEVLLTTDLSLGSQFPNVAAYNNVTHVVWTGYAPSQLGHIYYTRSTDGGTTWSTAVNLSSGASTNNDHAHVSAGPNGVVVAWNSSESTGAVYSRRSGDSGVSFTAAQLTAGGEGDSYYSRVTDLFTDNSGKVHLAYYDNSFAEPAGSAGMVRHRMSCDGGLTWGTDTAITATKVDGVFDNEQPRIAEAGSKIHIVYRGTAKGNPQGGWPPYTILMKSGTVSGCALTGISYPARRVAGGIPLQLATNYRPEIVGDAANALHVAWWDNTAGANVMYRKGAAATSTFGAPQSLTSFGLDHLEPGALTSTPAAAGGGYQAPPGLASNDTSLVMTYQQNAAKTSGVPELEYGPVFLRESSDNGVTWQGALPLAGTSQATTPRVAFIASNKVLVVWTDLRSGDTPRIWARAYTTGPATGPQLSITPSPQDFGAVIMGATSSRTLQVVNSGTAGSVTTAITGTNTGDFAVTANTCGGTIAAGVTCSVTVQFGPTTLGARTASLVMSGSGFSSSATLNGTANQAASGDAQNRLAVIRGFYETILGRTPDAAGVNFWNGEATRVSGLGADVREVFFALSVLFFGTPEYVNKNTSDAQYLTDLYYTFFLRAPDSGGMAFWQTQLNGGMDRGALLTNFLFSTEFSNKMTSLFGNPAIRPEVNMTMDLYRGILGVLPDSGGFNYWMGQIRAAQCQGAAAVNTSVSTIAEGFLTSAEYSQREVARPAAERTKRHIGDLYNAFLRRGADLGGYQYWAGQIDTGARTRAQVRAEFIKSPEFQGRVGQVIAAGCAS